jgi:antitoxin component YwqK of YwqJK toxin-antitoxin module
MKYFYLTLICLTIFLNLGAEIVNSYYPSGKIESTGNMVNGKKQGEWKWFFENGKISLQGKYFTDKEEGEWIWFHTNGIPFAIGYFVDGTPLGNWKRYNKYGKLLTEENSSWGDNAKSFREGIMYRNATCIGIRKDALQEGLWRYFSNNGDIIMECNYTNGKKNGIYKSYSRDYDLNEKINFTTEEGNYINGKREGVWKKVNALGIILQKMIFRNDILEGSYEKFDQDGVLLSSGQYKNGKKNGFWIENEDDVVFRGYYINDDLDGECTWYYSTGKIKYKGNYKQGKLIDTWKEYYENGILKEEGYIINGLKEGIWNFYLENGNLDSVATFNEKYFSNTDTLIKGKLSEGFVTYALNDKIGFMDSTGKIVLSHKQGYEYVGLLPYFKEGKCVFYKRYDDPKNRSSFQSPIKFGFINTKFDTVIHANYVLPSILCNGIMPTFSNGFSVVPYISNDKEEDRYIIIDSSANYSSEPFTYSNGCTAACLFQPIIADGFIFRDYQELLPSGYRSTFYDYLEVKTGKSFAVENCTMAGPFSDGIAAVEIDFEYITFINKLGKTINDKKFYTVKRGSSNISLYHGGNGCDRLGGFVNGKMLIHHFENNGYGREVVSLVDRKGNILMSKPVKDSHYDLYSEREFIMYNYAFD